MQSTSTAQTTSMAPPPVPRHRNPFQTNTVYTLPPLSANVVELPEKYIQLAVAQGYRPAHGPMLRLVDARDGYSLWTGSKTFCDESLALPLLHPVFERCLGHSLAAACSHRGRIGAAVSTAAPAPAAQAPRPDNDYPSLESVWAAYNQQVPQILPGLETTPSPHDSLLDVPTTQSGTKAKTPSPYPSHSGVWAQGLY